MSADFFCVLNESRRESHNSAPVYFFYGAIFFFANDLDRGHS